MKKLNILIPAGGDGTRFNNSEFLELKPFIKFKNKTMFEHLIDNFLHNHNSNQYIYIYIVIRREFEERYKKEISKIEKKYKNVKFLFIDKKSEGTTATALHFYDLLNNNDQLLLANCDQIIDIDLFDFIDKSSKYDGSLVLFDKETSKKFSFCVIKENLITKVVAKDNVSEFAVAGWYYWKKSSDFIKYGLMQIVTQTKVNNEYYLCPVYNFAINENKKIFPYLISRNKMHAIGEPEDLKEYISYLNKK